MLSVQMFVSFLSTSKVNLCFSNENAMTDFRKTWYVLHEVCLGPWYLKVLQGISGRFEKDLPHCFKMFSCVHLQINCILSTSPKYEQVFRSHLRVIFEKRNKLNCGDLTISCLHDTRVQFNELVWEFNLRVVPKIVYFFCLKI